MSQAAFGRVILTHASLQRSFDNKRIHPRTAVKNDVAHDRRYVVL